MERFKRAACNVLNETRVLGELLCRSWCFTGRVRRKRGSTAEARKAQYRDQALTVLHESSPEAFDALESRLRRWHRAQDS